MNPVEVSRRPYSPTVDVSYLGSRCGGEISLPAKTVTTISTQHGRFGENTLGW